MYTTHGLMTLADYADHLKDTDQGTTDVRLDDVPDWFEAPFNCPICGERVADHDMVTVRDASGEIIECLFDDEWQAYTTDERNRP